MKRVQHKFDAETVRGWRARILAGETYEAVADSTGDAISNCSVYYHVNKLGPLPSLEARRKGAVDPVPVRVAPRRRVAVRFASEIAEPSVASRMAGRARVARRIERLEGVEA